MELKYWKKDTDNDDVISLLRENKVHMYIDHWLYIRFYYDEKPLPGYLPEDIILLPEELSEASEYAGKIVNDLKLIRKK